MNWARYTTNSATSKNWIGNVGSLGQSLFFGKLGNQRGFPISHSQSQTSKPMIVNEVDYDDNYTSSELMRITETSLAKYWDAPEENEAWGDVWPSKSFY